MGINSKIFRHALLTCSLILLSTSAWSVSEQLSALERLECSMAQQRYEFLAKDALECTDNYLRFESAERAAPRSEIKIGSFNIVRMGTDQAQFKRYDITAKIINQWDLVGVVEIMPTPAAYQIQNRQVDLIVQQLSSFQNNYSFDDLKKYKDILIGSYKMPGYLRLLLELRKMDPSWSLIMGPRATGETSTSLEVSGFYYRAGPVENVTSNFCHGQRGCELSIAQTLKTIVSRIPFSATFKAGDLKFNAVALHLRFRENFRECLPGERPRESLPNELLDVEAKCRIFSNEAKARMAEYSDVGNAKFRSRYIEFSVINDALKNSQEDVMIMGDFNLPHINDGTRRSNDAFWKRAINDSAKEIFVHTKTSISRLNGLSGEYDHFIFNQKKITGCDTAQATSYNFLLDLKNPETEDAPLMELSEILKMRNYVPDQLSQNFSKSLNEKQRLTHCSQQDCLVQPFYPPIHQLEILQVFNDRIVNTSPKIPYKVFEDLISDHIPIFMNCKTTAQVPPMAPVAAVAP